VLDIGQILGIEAALEDAKDERGVLEDRYAVLAATTKTRTGSVSEPSGLRLMTQRVEQLELINKQLANTCQGQSHELANARDTCAWCMRRLALRLQPPHTHHATHSVDRAASKIAVAGPQLPKRSLLLLKANVVWCGLVWSAQLRLLFTHTRD